MSEKKTGTGWLAMFTETRTATRDPKAEQAAIDAGQVDEPGAMYRYDVSWRQSLMPAR
jgi:hypothetical protein